MPRRTWLAVPALLLAAVPAAACSLCLSAQQSLSFRQEAPNARMIVYGTVLRSELGSDGKPTAEFRIDGVVKNDPFLNGKKTLTLPRYLPVVNKNDPPRYLVFCDVFKDKVDAYRGVPVQSAAAVEYLKGALALDPKDRTRCLQYYFNYLEHPDKKIAEDAFLEFAQSNDQEVGQAAAKLSPAKLRGWLRSKETADYRLGLYAFLLGACGTAEDAAWFREQLRKDPLDERTLKAFDGLLGGYIHLRPNEGWDLALQILRDSRKPFPVRFAALRTVRFYHGWKPDETKAKVRSALAALLPQGDIADLAIEDLRRWQLWDLTGDVLALYGQKGFDAPIMKRTIVRYAIACPRPEAQRFVQERRQQEPDLVRDVEESLQFDRNR
ncbi:MAG TPA: hypothetical protein VFA26_22245 [Gemmataceae bacterium]|nr:hypothetical protein [Gemmataceae bacterium]